MMKSLKFFIYSFLEGFRKIPKALILLVLLWLPRLIKLLGELCRALCQCRRRRKTSNDCCVVFPPDTLLRPDPLIYSQYYLMAQGLAVTWNNPDIEIYKIAENQPPQLVPSHLLDQNTEYEVRVRIWNNSYDAPAPGLPVYLSFLTFGINTSSTQISQAFVNLPVKGAPDHPAIVPFKWKTPAAAGHYCLQARLEWPDDVNPDNNLGQENVNVGVFQSPAVFEFPISNERLYPRRFTLTADTYEFPALLDCDEYEAPDYSSINTTAVRTTGRTRLEESKARWKTARKRHASDAFPVPAGWSVEILPSEDIDLAPLEEKMLTVRITAPEGFSGSRTFNINAFESDQLVGGVTLIVSSKTGGE